jgi:dTMP kinase
MLITFEGIDGSGKSTQAHLLIERLRQSGRVPLLVREPGGTEVSERIRSILLEPGLHIVPFAEMLLFSAARAQLVAEVIQPAIANGQIVICDRFYDSTTAYQGGGRGVENPEWIRSFNNRVTGGLVPDRTYYFDISPEVAYDRRHQRNTATTAGEDRLESAGIAFYERVRKAYLDLNRAEPDRILVLDGSESIESLHQKVWDDVSDLLKEEGGTLP